MEKSFYNIRDYVQVAKSKFKSEIGQEYHKRPATDSLLQLQTNTEMVGTALWYLFDVVTVGTFEKPHQNRTHHPYERRHN